MVVVVVWVWVWCGGGGGGVRVVWWCGVVVWWCVVWWCSVVVVVWCGDEDATNHFFLLFGDFCVFVVKLLQVSISKFQSPISNLQSPISNLQSPISNLIQRTEHDDSPSPPP
jgi:hypothetical protein